MLLIIFALILLILLITIPIIWKLTTFMISFMIVIIGAIVTAPFQIIATIWNGNVPNQRIDSFWKDAPNDSTAMWIKGTDGRFFRYGLNLSDEAESHQMEELNKFYRNHMNG